MNRSPPEQLPSLSQVTLAWIAPYDSNPSQENAEVDDALTTRGTGTNATNPRNSVRDGSERRVGSGAV